MTAAGIVDCILLQSINKGGRVWGCGFSPKVIWGVVKEKAKIFEIPALAPHDLLRTCARLCHQAGRELEQIQFLLGHVSVQTTERYLGCQTSEEMEFDDATLPSIEFSQSLQNFIQGNYVNRPILRCNECSNVALETAEEAVGFADFGLQDYPSALDHFDRALHTRQALHENEAYQEVHCAEALWQLGRYQDAEVMVAKIRLMPGNAMTLLGMFITFALR